MGGGLSASIKAVVTWFNVIIRCNILLRAHTGSVNSRDIHIEHVKDNSYIIHSHAGSTGAGMWYEASKSTSKQASRGSMS